MVAFNVGRARNTKRTLCNTIRSYSGTTGPHFPLVLEQYRNKVKQSKLWPICVHHVHLRVFRALALRERAKTKTWTGLTCQFRNPLSRFTPLVRTKMSSGGLPASEVDKWASMESSVIVLSDMSEPIQRRRDARTCHLDPRR